MDSAPQHMRKRHYAEAYLPRQDGEDDGQYEKRLGDARTKAQYEMGGRSPSEFAKHSAKSLNRTMRQSTDSILKGLLDAK